MKSLNKWIYTSQPKIFMRDESRLKTNSGASWCFSCLYTDVCVQLTANVKDVNVLPSICSSGLDPYLIVRHALRWGKSSPSMAHTCLTCTSWNRCRKHSLFPAEPSACALLYEIVYAHVICNARELHCVSTMIRAMLLDGIQFYWIP